MHIKSKKPSNVWVGVIPDIFGYGINAIGHTRAGVMRTLRQSYDEWKKARPDPTTNFKDSYARFGGAVTKVEIDKAYHNNFNS
jgi:hypothetical protein